ncbi:uncharacterized protein LTR77_007165 [Saxophila tyrrhenica]|uniref:ASST-domain-containing protein n=1 Tax=Saxophila tyrrhenica TaxID=1690608 RepID=A0AAV9P5W3_9PEZI|nr:hypothetical protein LTR77_007165 [Saxophila tyrrhenica]
MIWLVLATIFGTTAAKLHPADPSQNITWPYHTYETVKFQPPWLNITHHTAPSEGYLFFAPDGATETQLAPVIMDMSGELIWNGPMEHAFNFGVYEYGGEPVLGWWNGTLFPEPVGRGNGVIYLYNNKYEQIEKVTLEGNFLKLEPGATFVFNIDVHELLITPNDTIVVTANNVTQADLTSVGGPTDGWVVDGLVYDIDIATNEVLFRWSPLEHLDQIPFNASLYTLGTEGYTGTSQSTAWGYFHINAAEPYEGGYIISSRFLCNAIAIDGSEGHVKWRLSGREGGDFNLVGSDATAGFCYQHDIRTVDVRDSGVTLRMHDNHNSPFENGTVPASGKVSDVDFGTKDAQLVQRYFNHSGPIFPTAQGNMQPLSNGNVFVGHGWIPVMEEFSSSGETLTTVQFGAAESRPGGGYFSEEAPTLSYRSFKQQWVGCPAAKPDVVAKASKNGSKVFVSWNGATDVVAWEIFAGSLKSKMHCVATVRKCGFETEGNIDDDTAYVQVRPVLKKSSSCDALDSEIVSVS